jgi:hypothetical protein
LFASLSDKDEKPRKDMIITRIGKVIIKNVTVISRESRVMKWRCKQGLITVNAAICQANRKSRVEGWKGKVIIRKGGHH